jgi:hypothetical protein
MITKETAYGIASAYQEIEAAEGLLKDIIGEWHSRDEAPDIRDGFGRRQKCLQLGVPSGLGGHRLFQVQWDLARPMIEAHIAQTKARLSALNIKAMVEASDHLPKPAELAARGTVQP